MTVSSPHALTAGADCRSQIVESTVMQRLPLVRISRKRVKEQMLKVICDYATIKSNKTNLGQ